MTIQHILYIPIIFVLGLVFGFMISERRQGIAKNSMATIGQNAPLQYKTSGTKLFQTFVIFLLVFLITHLFEIPWGSKAVSQLLGGVEIFDKRPIFSSIEIYNRISKFPIEGLIAYKHFTYTIDIIFPLSFFAFLLTFARFVSQRISVSKYSVNILISLPFLWFACDLIENAIIFNILSNYPSQSVILASSLGYITTVKFGLLLLSIFTPSLVFIFANKVKLHFIKKTLLYFKSASAPILNRKTI
jgi:hypothetical protein